MEPYPLCALCEAHAAYYVAFVYRQRVGSLYLCDGCLDEQLENVLTNPQVKATLRLVVVQSIQPLG